MIWSFTSKQNLLTAFCNSWEPKRSNWCIQYRICRGGSVWSAFMTQTGISSRSGKACRRLSAVFYSRECQLKKPPKNLCILLSLSANVKICWKSKRKSSEKTPSFFCAGIDLSSRAVSRQVLSALLSLTSVFGMGTGGTSA